MGNYAAKICCFFDLLFRTVADNSLNFAKVSNENCANVKKKFGCSWVYLFCLELFFFSIRNLDSYQLDL